MDLGQIGGALKMPVGHGFNVGLHVFVRWRFLFVRWRGISKIDHKSKVKKVAVFLHVFMIGDLSSDEDFWDYFCDL